MTISIPPADMLLFAAVVREGSFTRAARQLGVTKQTVSERIARLEERLGVRLLERTTRRLRTTDPGALYFERCAAIAAQVDEANSEVQRRQAEPVGLLRVSTPVLYGRRYLAPVVSDFLCRHPKIRVELLLADRRVDLIEEGLDVAIRIGVMADSSLSARKLGEGHVYCVASPGFLAEHGSPTPRTLRGMRCVGLRPVETWELGGNRLKMEPVLVVNDFEVACDAAIAGVGLALLPSIVCRHAVADGRLRVVLGPQPAFVRPVVALYPSRRYLPAKVRLFIDALATMIEPMQPLDTKPASSRRRRAAGKAGRTRG